MGLQARNDRRRMPLSSREFRAAHGWNHSNSSECFYTTNGVIKAQGLGATGLASAFRIEQPSESNHRVSLKNETTKIPGIGRASGTQERSFGETHRIDFPSAYHA